MGLGALLLNWLGSALSECQASNTNHTCVRQLLVLHAEGTGVARRGNHNWARCVTQVGPCTVLCFVSQVPEIAFTGDTSGELFEKDGSADIYRAKLLIVECTFVDDSVTWEQVRPLDTLAAVQLDGTMQSAVCCLLAIERTP